MRIDIPHNFTPRPYQLDTWRGLKTKKRGITVWPRRNGKDKTFLNLLIKEAVKRVGTYFYMLPYYKQARLVIWEGADKTGFRFLDHVPKQLIKKQNNQEMVLELKNGSVIRLLGSDNIDSIVGSNPIGIVFSEFSLHKPGAWNYLRPVLRENGGWALFNGTPRGLNHFYELYRMAQGNEEWFVDYKTNEETGIPTEEDIQQEIEAGMPESLADQEFRCSWTTSAEDVLIPLDIINPAIDRDIPDTTWQYSPRIMGVDVAFAEKGDKAIIARRQGPLLLPFKKFRGIDNMAFAARIAEDIEEWGPNLVNIDAGRGEGVISRLCQLGYEDIVNPVNFGGTPDSDLYSNRKAQLWSKMKGWFAGAVEVSIPADSEFIQQTSAPTFVLNDKYKVQIESKKQLKSRGIASTDCADAVIVTFDQDIHEPAISMRERELQAVMSQFSREEQYDPTNYFELHALAN